MLEHIYAMKWARMSLCSTYIHQQKLVFLVSPFSSGPRGVKSIMLWHKNDRVSDVRVFLFFFKHPKYILEHICVLIRTFTFIFTMCRNKKKANAAKIPQTETSNFANFFPKIHFRFYSFSVLPRLAVLLACRISFPKPLSGHLSCQSFTCCAALAHDGIFTNI